MFADLKKQEFYHALGHSQVCYYSDQWWKLVKLNHCLLPFSVVSFIFIPHIGRAVKVFHPITSHLKHERNYKLSKFKVYYIYFNLHFQCFIGSSLQHVQMDAMHGSTHQLLCKKSYLGNLYNDCLLAAFNAVIKVFIFHS